MREMGPWFVACVALLMGCRDNAGAPPPLAATLPEGSAEAPVFRRIEDEPAAPAASASPEANDQTDEPEAAEGADGEQADAADQADEADEGDQKAKEASAPKEDDATEAAAPAGNAADIEVKNVGMHIGGEDNSADAKRPIRAEIAKHYDAMRTCYARATDPPKATTFSVDIRIPGQGGPPKISNPRSGLKGEGVKECMVAVFEGVAFPKQPNGQPRMVSYSVEFRRK